MRCPARQGGRDQNYNKTFKHNFPEPPAVHIQNEKGRNCSRTGQRNTRPRSFLWHTALLDRMKRIPIFSQTGELNAIPGYTAQPVRTKQTKIAAGHASSTHFCSTQPNPDRANETEIATGHASSTHFCSTQPNPDRVNETEIAAGPVSSTQFRSTQPNQ